MKDTIKNYGIFDSYSGILAVILLIPAIVSGADLLKPCKISTPDILPFILLVIPLLGTALYFLIKKDRIKDILSIITICICIIQSLLMIKYIFISEEIDRRSTSGLSFIYTYMPNFNLHLNIDKISMAIIIIASVSWLIFSIYVFFQNYSGSLKYKGYNLNILVALFLNYGVLMAGDFLTLFLFFEALSIFPYFTLIYRKSAIVAHEEKKFLFLEVTTGISLLLGIVLFYFFTNTLEMKNMSLFFATQMHPLWSGILFVLMVVGFAGKTSLFFQHIFPSKIKSNVLLPVPGSFVFSGLMFQIALYSIYRYITVALYKV